VSLAQGGEPRRVIIGISGSTGVIYGIRLLEVLRGVPGVETHLVVTLAGRQTIGLETDYGMRDVEALAHVTHHHANIAAPIASGSFRAAGMIVAPCSMKTLAGIASSFSENLLLRAADVTLKERRPLVLLARETPLHLGHLRHMVQLTEMGAIIAPPVPAFYHRPTSLDGIVNQTVNRALDLLGIRLPEDLFQRWGSEGDGEGDERGEGTGR
jgi:4-hydroxy-3-polyprenylbenzoate decarboxylase